ncbi:TPA: DUF5309 family protein [Enterobacter cloacae]|nr:DUF5309 family protein [Enterobacter cloacae]
MLHSFDSSGVKDSFSDLISNISPDDTYVVSNSKKEGTPGTIFKWQNDALDSVVYDGSKFKAIEEGSTTDTSTEIIKVKGTVEKTGNTQIFKTSFAISDSALSSSVHGRKGELELQLMKAGKELKNIMETSFLSDQTSVKASSGVAPVTDGLLAQIADIDVDNPQMPDPTTIGLTAGAFTVHKSGTIDFDILDSICVALYRNGSKANVILTNPFNSSAINSAIDEADSKKVRQRLKFKEDNSIKLEMNTFTDSLGRVWDVIYDRFAPTSVVYFIDSESITQRVLREPVASKLGKTGSFETWQLIIESGLQVSHPYANGALEITGNP